jgi:hypothetical protein
MKTMNKAGLLLMACGMLSLTTVLGSAIESRPAPQLNVSVVGFVPNYCFWDGNEYVGWFDGIYYYWGADHVWYNCDPIRLQHINVWRQAHPNWRAQVTSTASVQSSFSSSVKQITPAAKLSPCK